MAYSKRSDDKDLRRSLRFRTAFDANLVHRDYFLSVIVRDISADGISVQGNRLPEEGARVTVRAKGLDVRGWVIWRDGDIGGISLSQAIDPLAVVRANLKEFQEIRGRCGTYSTLAWHPN